MLWLKEVADRAMAWKGDIVEPKDEVKPDETIVNVVPSNDFKRTYSYMAYLGEKRLFLSKERFQLLDMMNLQQHQSQELRDQYERTNNEVDLVTKEFEVMKIVLTVLIGKEFDLSDGRTIDIRKGWQIVKLPPEPLSKRIAHA
jgi:hypothetical protein